MSEIDKRIKDLLEETKSLVAKKEFDKAKKILESILILDETNEEAKYVLERIDSIPENTVITSPNVFIEDNLWGALVVSRYYINGSEILKIWDRGSGHMTLQPGKYDLLIKATMLGEFRSKIEIKNSKTQIFIRTFQIKMGFRMSAEVTSREL